MTRVTVAVETMVKTMTVASALVELHSDLESVILLTMVIEVTWDGVETWAMVMG